MSPLIAVDTTNDGKFNYVDKEPFGALYQELEKGIQSVKNGEVYTIEEAWEQIDKI